MIPEHRTIQESSIGQDCHSARLERVKESKRAGSPRCNVHLIDRIVDFADQPQTRTNTESQHYVYPCPRSTMHRRRGERITRDTREGFIFEDRSRERKRLRSTAAAAAAAALSTQAKTPRAYFHDSTRRACEARGDSTLMRGLPTRRIAAGA